MIDDALSLSVPPDSPPAPDADPEVGDGLSLAEPDDSEAQAIVAAAIVRQVTDPSRTELLAERLAALHLEYAKLQITHFQQADALRAAEIRAVAAREEAALREADVARLTAELAERRLEIAGLRALLAPLQRVARLALPLCQTLAGWSFNRDVAPGPALAALREAIRDVDRAMATGDEGSARPPGSLGSPAGGTGGGSGDGPVASGETRP